MSKNEELQLSVKYKDMEVKFSGSPEDVLRSFFRFMSKVLPAFDLASNLTLTVDLERLLKNVSGIVAFTPEGPVITLPREKMGGERNAIILHLLKAYIGFQTGKLERDSLSTAEILSLTGGKAGTVAARLSELTSLGWVERIGRGEYRITTLGINGFIEEILPRIKTQV